MGLFGAAVECWGLRRVHKWGHVPELLFTFGLSYIIFELVQVLWGRAPVPYPVPHGSVGSGRLSADGRHHLPAVPLVHDGGGDPDAAGDLAAADAHSDRAGDPGGADASRTVEALGHNVPRVFMLVFGAGCALAGLAGVIGGNAFVTEPGMAGGVGAIVFVVIVFGGLGSLGGALVASIVLGLVDSFGKTSDASLAGLLNSAGRRTDAAVPLAIRCSA